MIFINSEINEVDQEALYSESLESQRDLRRQIFKFHRKQHFSAMLMGRYVGEIKQNPHNFRKATVFRRPFEYGSVFE